MRQQVDLTVKITLDVDTTCTNGMLSVILLNHLERLKSVDAAFVNADITSFKEEAAIYETETTSTAAAKPKVIVLMEEGVNTGCYSNTDIEVVFIDVDSNADETVCISGPKPADEIFTDGKAYKLSENIYYKNEKNEVKQFLKGLNF